ncbi:uncharacterized protein LOC121696293 isoform X2 [Alosa sapidissima]|uniref:uncharacterized protein LOC121696293 isoform X2 n=1 Tax=Alosa sapidissima TaxID=34773 RepID=UPI001C091D55|nr:uncharacterized protein LOC121696293 isoform X2 [Alosa sapidissima]
MASSPKSSEREVHRLHPAFLKANILRLTAHITLWLYRRTYRYRSKTSLVEFKSTALCDQLETSFDLTKESLCLSVMQDLMKKLIERQSQSLSGDLRDYSSHVVEEVVVSVFRALRTSGQNGVSAQETTEMLQQVSNRLCGFSTKQDAARAQVSPAEDETLESTLACTARDTMDALIQTMEDCLEDGDKFKPTKNILATLKKVVQVLACRSTSLEEFKADAVIDRDCKSRSLEQANTIESAQMLSSEEFHSKLAVTDVLCVHGFLSTPSVNSRLTPSASPVGNILENKPAISSRSAPVLSGSFPQTVDPATTILIETFVGEIRKIAQSYEASSCEGNSLKAEKIAAEEALDYEASVTGAKKSSVLEAAVHIYHKVHTTVRDLFKQPHFYQSKGDVIPNKNDTHEQECQGLSFQGLPLSN